MAWEEERKWILKLIKQQILAWILWQASISDMRMLCTRHHHHRRCHGNSLSHCMLGIVLETICYHLMRKLKQRLGVNICMWLQQVFLSCRMLFRSVSTKSNRVASRTERVELLYYRYIQPWCWPYKSLRTIGRSYTTWSVDFVFIVSRFDDLTFGTTLLMKILIN